MNKRILVFLLLRFLDCGPMSGFDNAKVDEEFFGAGKECEAARNSLVAATLEKANTFRL